MTPRIPTLPETASDDQIMTALDASGAVILQGFLASPVVDAFNQEVDEIIAAERGTPRDYPSEAIAGFFGDEITHVSGIAGKSKTFVDHVLCHPRYMSICDKALLPHCADYQLNIAHLMERLPGSEAQFLHRDGWVWKRLPALSGDGDVQIASLIALGEFTADNGGTRVVPGSHRWEEDRYPKPEEAIAVEMNTGDAVIYLGRTFHGGGANVTQDVARRGIHISYTLGWLRTEENNVLSTPPAVAAQMPRRAQELLGFGIHDDLAVGGGYLGVVELSEPWKHLA